MPARTAPGDIEHLLRRADALAVPWAASAASRTTSGQQRAILRMFGVTGVDRDGRPLAAEVVDRHLAPDPGRLGAEIALPFAMAMAEYDLGPQELALDVAAGAIDLALEAELLAEPDRRAVAEADALRLAASAMERIDANRVARLELLDVLGDGRRPYVGMPLEEPAIVDALDEARDGVMAGIDLLRVAVPPGRELNAGLERAGRHAVAWQPAHGSRPGLEAPDPAAVPVPTGSQRALAVLRRAADELAARRGAYVRLATEAPALTAPEQAVVACFERIDLVIADPMREIVAGRVDPDRAIVDHAFAHRLLVRSGASLLIGPGPLVVAPDLALGIPSDPATRAGRALALQLLAVRLALLEGMPADRVWVGAMPEWIAEEPDAAARAAAEVAARRLLFPGHPLAFVEPPVRDDLVGTWGAILGSVLPDAGETALILRRPVRPPDHVARATGAAISVAASLARATPAPLGHGAAAHLEAVLTSAQRTLEVLEGDGWRSVMDDPVPAEGGRLGGDAVAERRESFDPFDAAALAGARD
jgi:hypothetical protein